MVVNDDVARVNEWDLSSNTSFVQLKMLCRMYYTWTIVRCDQRECREGHHRSCKQKVED